MQCTQCGNDNPAGAHFCGTCGFSLLEYATGIWPDSYGRVNLVVAVRLGFQKYFEFKGRSTRAEFWWWALFVLLGNLLLGVASFVVGVGDLLSTLFQFGTLIPSLALGARRLHDINRTGWWQLMLFASFLIIPLIVLYIWAALQGGEGLNRYGQSPRQPTL
jgi:uncharacterized membrane protein YhaH (DUF805 family)